MAETGDYYSQFDEDKNTDLHYAAAHNNIDEVKELLEKTYKIDSENCLGWTPLMMAARNGNLEIVKLLIDYKADATKKNAYGEWNENIINKIVNMASSVRIVFLQGLVCF